jgi:hypothetical protein
MTINIRIMESDRPDQSYTVIFAICCPELRFEMVVDINGAYTVDLRIPSI